MDNYEGFIGGFLGGVLITIVAMLCLFTSVERTQEIHRREAAVRGGYGHYDDKTGDFVWGINK